MNALTKSNLLGYRNECTVCEVLRQMQANEASGLPSPIESVIHSKPNGRLDKNGIDVLTVLKNGREIPIQVKSSWRSARKFAVKQRHLAASGIKRLYKNILLVVVEVTDTVEMVRKKLWKQLQQFFAVECPAGKEESHLAPKTRVRRNRNWFNRSPHKLFYAKC